MDVASLIVLFAGADPTETLALIAAIVGPVGAYLVASRRLSGKIATSDAEQLWAESKSIRDWSKEQINMQAKEIQELRAALSIMSKRFDDLQDDYEKMSKELERAHQRIRQMEGEKGGV